MKENKKMINKKIILIAVSFFALLFLIMTSIRVMAVDDYALMESLPNMAANSTPSLGVYLQNMFNIGLGVAGVLAVIMITIGGVLYMTTEAVGGKSSAKSIINNAVLGLVLALASFLLLKTINPAFINAPLTLKPVPAPLATPPSKETTVWEGVCKLPSGSPFTCSGGNIDICQSSCEKQCGGISYTCTESSGKWSATCIKIGDKHTTSCANDLSSESLCKTSCDADCTKTKPIYFTPCTKTVNVTPEED